MVGARSFSGEAGALFSAEPRVEWPWPHESKRGGERRPSEFCRAKTTDLRPGGVCVPPICPFGAGTFAQLLGAAGAMRIDDGRELVLLCAPYWRDASNPAPLPLGTGNVVLLCGFPPFK